MKEPSPLESLNLKSGQLNQLGSQSEVQMRSINIETGDNICIEEDADGNPSFILNFDRALGLYDAENITLSPILLDPKFIRYHLVVNVLSVNSNDKMRIDVKWALEVFGEEKIRKFIREFINTLEVEQ